MSFRRGSASALLGATFFDIHTPLRFCDPASRRFELVEHSARPLAQAQSDANDMKFAVNKDAQFAFSSFREMDWRREAAEDLEAPRDVRRRALRTQQELARRP